MKFYDVRNLTTDRNDKILESTKNEDKNNKK